MGIKELQAEYKEAYRELIVKQIELNLIRLDITSEFTPFKEGDVLAMRDDVGFMICFHQLNLDDYGNTDYSFTAKPVSTICGELQSFGGLMKLEDINKYEQYYESKKPVNIKVNN